MINFQTLREQAFGFFYVLTERSVQPGNESRLRTTFWSLLYLVDAGQVISAMAQPSYGWHPEVLLYLDKLDVFKTIFTSVCARHFLAASLVRSSSYCIPSQLPNANILGRVLFVTATALVSITTANVAAVVYMLQV